MATVKEAPTRAEYDPTVEEANAANAGVYAGSTRTVERVGGNKLLKIGLATTAVGAVGYGIYETVPAVHERVDSFLNSFTDKRLVPRVETNTVNPDEVFDSGAIEGVISERNITRLPQTEIDRLFPTAFGKLREDGNNTMVSIRQPIPESERAKQPGVNIPDLQFEIREDKGTLELQYPIDLSQSSNPNAKIKFRKYFRGFTAADRVAFKGEDNGFYDSIEFFNVPKGARIKPSLRGFLTISSPDNNRKIGVSDGGFTDFQAPNGNIYRLAILGEKGNDINVLKPLVDAPDVGSVQGNQPVGSYGLEVGRDEEIFEVTRNLDKLTFTVFTAIKGQIGKPQEWKKNPLVFTNLELISSNGHILSSSKK